MAIDTRESTTGSPVVSGSSRTLDAALPLPRTRHMHIRIPAALLALGLAIAAPPAAIARQQDTKAAEILAATRKAIGKKLEGLTSLGLQAASLRNIGNFQMNS